MKELDLFTAALACQDQEARSKLLDQHCQGNPQLRQRLDELLNAYRQADQVLPDVPVIDPDVTKALAENENDRLIGTVVAGKYKLLESIGEGGMGTVFVAEQTEPVKRKVAVKLIKPGMDSKSVLARFEAERQALAMMDHPNIARVLDAGLTEERRPYFVMEYIKGLPLTKYCDDTRLSIAERLNLFIQVCQAVQHAHQKGIIHRDLKPGNILIALYDGKPVPKVIDFGLAKALHQSLTERTLHTGHEMVLGTPLYMSPEQAELNNLDIDTRSDIYSLGVILYELLTGVTPLEKQRFKEAAWAEVLRIIKEEEPSKPSTKLSHSASLPSVAAQRQMEPKKLSSLIKGDLDWIVMKSLEKDRNRRYETANGFAADVMRYLSGEPVIAAPPSTAYRLKKFVRRNRGFVIAAGLVFVTLLVGIAGTSWGMLEANHARNAEQERAEGERQAKLDADAKRQEAEKNLGYAKKGMGILGAVFSNLDANKKYSDLGEFRQALANNLKQAVRLLNGTELGDPLVVADLQHILGMSLLSMGEASLANEILSKALSAFQVHRGADHPETLHCMNDQATCYQRLGKIKQAIPLFKQAYEQLSNKLGDDDPTTLMCLNNLAESYRADGNTDLALPLFEKVLTRCKQKFGMDHDYTLVVMSNLADVYREMGRADLTVPLYEQSLNQMKVKLGIRHPVTITAMNNLALAYYAVGNHKKSMSLSEETVKLSSIVLGSEHPSTLVCKNILANSLRASGQFDKALLLYEETLKQQKAKLGRDHPDTLVSMNNLAMTYRTVGKLDLALPLLEETLILMKAKLGTGHPETLSCLYNLASTYQKQGNHQLALPPFEEMAAGLENKQFQHQESIRLMRDLIDCYLLLKKYEQAEAWQRKYLNAVTKLHGPNSMLHAQQLYVLTLVLLAQNKWREAESALFELINLIEKNQPDSWSFFNAHSLLGAALMGQKKYGAAEPLLLKGYQGLKAREKTIPSHSIKRVPESLDRLIQFYTETNKPEEVKKWQAEKEKLPKTVEKKN